MKLHITIAILAPLVLAMAGPKEERPKYKSLQIGNHFTCRYCSGKGSILAWHGDYWDEGKQTRSWEDCRFCKGTGWWIRKNKSEKDSDNYKYQLYISKWNHIPFLVYADQPDQHPPSGKWMPPAEIELAEYEGDKTRRVVVMFPVIPKELETRPGKPYKFVPSTEHIREVLPGVPTNKALRETMTRLYQKQPYPLYEK